METKLLDDVSFLNLIWHNYAYLHNLPQSAIYDVTEQPNTQTPKVPVQDPNYSHVGDTSSEEGKTYSVLDRKDDRGGKSRGKIGPKQNGGEYSSLEQKV
jgi:hypothetical protein